MSVDAGWLHWKSLRLWCAVLASILLFGVVGGAAYVRLGTTVVGNFPSPDGRWDAVLMVRNGGAMTGYATVISLVDNNNWLARQTVLFRPQHLFVADDNDGAVSWGDHGQINVKAGWVTDTQLVVTYPQKARVLKRDLTFQSVNVRYVASE